MSGSFENGTFKLFVYKSFMKKQDLALNNLQALICHKNPTNHSTNQPT